MPPRQNCLACRPRSAITAAPSSALPTTSRKVPTQLHFGEKDAGIPLTDVETIKSKRPEVEVYIYPGAQHGFHCDERASYDKASAEIAWPRSLEFFAKHMKK